MSSNLSCIGFPVADKDALASLVSAIFPEATPIGHADGVDIARWEDASSGARLVLGVDHGSLVDLLPSLASRVSTHLGGLRGANDEVATAAVLADDGDQLTSVALELEQRRLLGTRVIEHVDAAIVAFAQAVTIHPDVETFEASRDSLVDPNVDTESEPPRFAQGITWPPRMAPESFISVGVFGDRAQSAAVARLNGTILTAGRRTNTYTRQPFIVARVRTAGFEADVCLNSDEHPNTPRPGQILAGYVFLVGSAPALEPAAER